MVSQVSNLETSAWQRSSIMGSNSEIQCKLCLLNVFWLDIVKRGKQCDTISFVNLKFQEFCRCQLSPLSDLNHCVLNTLDV